MRPAGWRKHPNWFSQLAWVATATTTQRATRLGNRRTHSTRNTGAAALHGKGNVMKTLLYPISCQPCSTLHNRDSLVPENCDFDFKYLNSKHYFGVEMLSIPIKTRTTRTPTFWDTPRPTIIHASDSRQTPSQNKTKSKLQIKKKCPKFEIVQKTLHMRHTFWSCLIRCINMKWIESEL